MRITSITNDWKKLFKQNTHFNSKFCLRTLMLASIACFSPTDNTYDINCLTILTCIEIILIDNYVSLK